ncbi:MAG: hypothetical protein NTY12_00040 [Candidatus Falkowbacteria bacterium]|nr:hypothetical protein [Candidatus Falkowbacteria bacterium]
MLDNNSNSRLNQMMSEANNGSGENFKLGIILISILIIVLAIIFGVYLFRSKEITKYVDNTAVNQEDNNGSIVDRVLGTVKVDTNNNQDSDKDGLSDQEEATVYKTDPQKIDTDGDGLSDREEVKVYKTDPLKIDTDGDGMSDGQEIKLRRNPLDANPSAEWPPRPNDLSTKK